MAINIFSGGASRSKPVNSASASTRAQAARNALGGNAVTSDSGNTAVKPQGTLAKVGNVVGKVAGVASKFLPGIAGTIAGGLANVLNDPEWWQSVPGEQITMNVPLRQVATGVNFNGYPVLAIRPAFAEFVSGSNADVNINEQRVIYPTEMMITQYLMPQIRKVVNAVPLQAAADYRTVFMAHATIYAVWRHLKKCDYLLKHGQTYLPNLNDSTFPVFEVANAAWLQSTINRLEEYLRANVRLPHTLCEYLAWRFGRFYRSHATKKAGIISYAPVVSLHSSIADINEFISSLMSVPSLTEGTQKANADIYNAYFDHDLMVEIRDDTQLTYDPKEFALRTNCDIDTTGLNRTGIPVYIDSALDNTTVFMASTVSTRYLTNGTDADNAEALFPVAEMSFYVYMEDALWESGSKAQQFYNTGWNMSVYNMAIAPGDPSGGFDEMTAYSMLIALNYMKALDIYNKNVMLAMYSDTESYRIDLTQPASDMGVTTDVVIQNEQVFAFANLINIDRRRSMTIGTADKLAATEVANMVDKIDIATAGTPVAKP